MHSGRVVVLRGGLILQAEARIWGDGRKAQEVAFAKLRILVFLHEAIGAKRSFVQDAAICRN